jgi:hypothetical protein
MFPGVPTVHRRLTGPALLLALGAASASAQSLDGHPFRTLSPTPLASRDQVLEVGLDYRSGVVPQPLLSDEPGDLTQVPEVRYRLGFGRAELSIGGAAWQSFSPDSAALDDESEVGDLNFWISVNALEQRRHRLALGFALGAKLPNASNESGLGTDEADTFFAVLLGRSDRSLEWRMNVGLAILGDPAKDASQEDLLTYAFAMRLGRRHCFAWEVYGRTASSDDSRDLEESTLEAGYLYRGRRIQAELSLTAGLATGSGDWGASAGVSWLFARDRN